MIDQMSPEAARKYFKVRISIEELVDRIHAIADLMSMFIELDEGAVTIKPRTLGVLGKIMATDVIWITSKLDNEFVCYSELTSLLLSKQEKSPKK